MRELSVYIHIPFCIRKCLYCDFLSFENNSKNFELYKNALIDEINKSEQAVDTVVKTVFIGGGTPTVMPCGFIADILNTLRNKFNITADAEITIEANPGTIDFDKLIEYRKSGINRISIGVQALQDNILKTLGRIHNREQFFEGFELIKKAGFQNINLDLMFALPNQSTDDWCQTLSEAIALKPTHISAYSLIIEEGTPFFELFEENRLRQVSDEQDREMYYIAKDMLAEAGYRQYEISNFAKDGFECRHNIVYWKRKEYIGFGLGACSFIAEKRLKNNTDLYRYMAGQYFGDIEHLSKEDAYAEFMFLGLRMRNGVSKKEFFEYFSIDMDTIYSGQIKGLIEKGLLTECGERLCLTEKGIDLSNIVFEEFLI